MRTCWPSCSFKLIGNVKLALSDSVSEIGNASLDNAVSAIELADQLHVISNERSGHGITSSHSIRSLELKYTAFHARAPDRFFLYLTVSQ